jgi:hypothetical protein
MTGAIVIRWGAIVPGREAKAFEVFGGALQRFEELQKAGRIFGHREYFALTGEDGGIAIGEGELNELLAIVAEEETIRLNAKSAAIVQDFSVTVMGGGTDQAIQDLLTTSTGALAEIGYL